MSLTFQKLGYYLEQKHKSLYKETREILDLLSDYKLTDLDGRIHINDDAYYYIPSDDYFIEYEFLFYAVDKLYLKDYKNDCFLITDLIGFDSHIYGTYSKVKSRKLMKQVETIKYIIEDDLLNIIEEIKKYNLETSFEDFVNQLNIEKEAKLFNKYVKFLTTETPKKKVNKL